MKKTICSLALFAGSFFAAGAAEKSDFTVSKSDIHQGYVVKRIWLQSYAIPDVTIGNTTYSNVDILPVDAVPDNAANIQITLGKERKKPFALVRIPVYNNANGMMQQLASFSINVTEKAVSTTAGNAAQKTTSITNSPLATGKWYKVAVSYTGLCKIDYDFIASKLGITGPINSASIRVFGRGGNMLSENNAVARPVGLTEDAIWVNDGGDGAFGKGDYFVFFAEGPVSWNYDSTTKHYKHVKNLYEDKGYYLLNFDGEAGKRVGTQDAVPAGNVTVNSYDDYVVFDEDDISPAKFGKTWWWKEEFSNNIGKSTQHTVTMDLGDNTGMAYFKMRASSSCPNPGSTLNASINGQPGGNFVFYAATDNNLVGDANRPFDQNDVSDWTAVVTGQVPINITYQPTATDGRAFLDYIEANVRRPLAFRGSAVNFRDASSVANGNIASFELGNANSNTQVWDVTDPQNPVRMKGTLNGSTYTFSQDAGSLHEYAAMNSDQLLIPEYAGTVDNQNLQGQDQTDMVIVSHPDFLNAANKIADFHRNHDHIRVTIVTPQQIYNEFSSGGQDITAIRDYMKMFYDRAGNDSTQMPRYLLLFGDASYDYKNRVAGNTNFVPTHESYESYTELSSYCDDDFYGMLDDNENIETIGIANTLDIGIGRLPVKTLDEAEGVVNKIKQYKAPSSLGPWRLSTTLVADNEDGAGPHMDDEEIMEATINSQSNLYNATKVYEDAIPFTSTPGGARAPEANKMINDQMYKGTVLINYSGHGNTEVLSHERIVTQDDYNKWTNLNKMPFSVTATCDFGQFDQPQFVSAGEQIVLKKDGGVISSVTTVKLVFQSSNRELNRDYLKAQFEKMDDRWNTFGDAFRIGKNITYSVATTGSSDIINFRKFALLGDPALLPDFPEHSIYVNNIKDVATGLNTDTMSALGSYEVSGYVGDSKRAPFDNFNGRLYVTIYDKPRVVSTISGIGKTFTVRNNIIYKGKATVVDGKFAFAFIAPKDINYDMGNAKISLYAENGETDAAGADYSYSIGGYSDHPIYETDGPVVRAFIGDSLFRNGGLTGSNTLLYAILEDETGINVSGNSVGHDLVAILDGDVENQYILNDYYETEYNTYKRGYVNFPMSNISDGRHRITIKAWDVNNNSGTGSVDFEVANGNIVKIQKVMNYPNPFRDVTHFVFENNHPNEYMYGEVNIYNEQGVLVRNLKQVFQTGVSRSNEITWDGTDNNGAKQPSGVYLYRMRIVSDKGAEDMGYQKLVLIR